jgi:hypothetical protein
MDNTNAKLDTRPLYIGNRIPHVLLHRLLHVATRFDYTWPVNINQYDPRCEFFWLKKGVTVTSPSTPH